MFENLKNIGSMMQQAQQMQARLKEARDRVGEIRVEGSSGGDMVRVTASGDMNIVGVQIDASLLETQDREMTEELVMAAVNQALQKAKEKTSELMAEAAGGMNIPGLNEALTKLGLSG